MIYKNILTTWSIMKPIKKLFKIKRLAGININQEIGEIIVSIV